jgi:PAS domain S-box-containing protein
MPWVEKLSDLDELRRCVRDLVTLATLPAIWRNYNPQQIADSAASALLSLLNAEFIYVSLADSQDEPIVEVTRIGDKLPAGSASKIDNALRLFWLGRSGQTTSIANPSGEGNLRFVCTPIGTGGRSTLVVGSLNPDFPRETQRLLIGIAANDATVALQRWRAKSEERRILTIIERSSDFIGFASLEGVLQYLNPAGRNLVGLGGNKKISQLNIRDFLAEHEWIRVRDEIMPLVLRSGRWVGELIFKNFKTGEPIPILVDWFRIDDPRTERPMNLATISRDLRNHKKLEFDLRQLNDTLERRVLERTAELADANSKLMMEIAERKRADARALKLQSELLHSSRLSAAGQMAGALAHEINQPLTALTNSVNAVRRLMVDGECRKIDTAREILDEAAGQALRAGHIIAQLREFVARGETDIRIENLPVIIQDATDFALGGTDSELESLNFNFDPNAQNVLANRTQVQQLLVNLMRNAIEAMADCERRELDVRTALLGEDLIETSIADSGPGLSAEISKHLFEPFHSTKRDGMGLGLSICRSIVEAHGGSLKSEINPNGGAIFRFTLRSAPTNGALDAG